MGLLGYDDITFIPRVVSDIEHRSTDCDTSSMFGDFKLSVPLIAAPMPDVCDGKMAALLREHGAFGFIHRFNTIDGQVKEFRISKASGGCAIGATGDYLERFDELVKNGCSHFCIDTANGANLNVKRAVEKILNKKECHLTVGNICSKENFEWLQKLPVFAIRCGIAGGGACITKTETGVHSPMVTMLNELRKIDKRAKVIADGSCKIPAHFCKAIALGADFVMVGSILASTIESPAKSSGVMKIFRGAASQAVQEEVGKTPEYVEGATNYIPNTGPLIQTITRFRNGLRSSMSYFNSRNITEYRENVTWLTN